MIYRAIVRAERHPWGHKVLRRLRQYKTGVPRARTTADYMRGRIEGRSVADIGCMWKINGAHSFLAEEIGASRVVAVDTYRTPEFDEELARRHSTVQFLAMDATTPGGLHDAFGVVDVVWCFGVLYHVLDPLQLMRNLREVCGELLVLETATIPEVPWLPQAACFFPYLPARSQQVWRDRSLPAGLAISKDFDEAGATANNFWGMSPSAVVAALRVCGFEVEHHEPSLHGTLRTVFFARPLEVPGS